MKERLDILLVKQGLAESREKAKAVIMAGEVFVQGQREDKAGASFRRAAARADHVLSYEHRRPAMWKNRRDRPGAAAGKIKNHPLSGGAKGEK